MDDAELGAVLCAYSEYDLLRTLVLVVFLGERLGTRRKQDTHGEGGEHPPPATWMSCLYVGCHASRDHGLALWVCSVPSGPGPGAVRS